MKSIGFFSEMNLYADSGSVHENLLDAVDYDKGKIIDYLQAQKRVAGCPRDAIDCMTGRSISSSFSVYTDGEYEWCDFLIYHVEKYNVKLPKEFIEKVETSIK